MFRRRWPLARKVLRVVALAVGALAFLVVRGYAGRVEARTRPSDRRSRVVTAATDLARGTRARPTTCSRRRACPRRSCHRARSTTTPSDRGSRAGGRHRGRRGAHADAARRLRVGPVAALVPRGLRAVVVAGGGARRAAPRRATGSTCSRRSAAAGRTRRPSRPASRSCAVLGDGAATGAGSAGDDGRCRRALRAARRAPTPPSVSPTRRRSASLIGDDRRPRPRRIGTAPRGDGGAAGALAWRGPPDRKGPPRDHPAGDHPRPDAGRDGVRAGLELGAPDPGAVALRLVDPERPRR